MVWRTIPPAHVFFQQKDCSMRRIKWFFYSGNYVLLQHPSAVHTLPFNSESGLNFLILTQLKLNRPANPCLSLAQLSPSIVFAVLLIFLTDNMILHCCPSTILCNCHGWLHPVLWIQDTIDGIFGIAWASASRPMF